MRSREQPMGGTLNCYDILTDVDAAMRDSILLQHNYYMLGGIASGALMHESTVLDGQAEVVVARQDSAIPTLRANGTRRDIDILVDSVLPDEDSGRIKAAVSEVIGNKLVVSVFGLDQHQTHMTRVNRYTKNAVEWLSSRTIDDAGTLRYELFPLSRVVSAESYKPWKLQLPKGGTVEVFHPAGHTLAYSMRSISGVRAKDENKYDAMKARVLPQFKEEVEDGIFKEWAQFASDIEAMRTGGQISREALRYNSRAVDLRVFTAKSRLLHWAESHEGIVNIAQQELAQKALNLFVRAK